MTATSFWRLILAGDFHSIERNLYTAGVDAVSYEIKYTGSPSRKKRLRSPSPFFLNSTKALIGCPRLSVTEKFCLAGKLARLTLSASAGTAEYRGLLKGLMSLNRGHFLSRLLSHGGGWTPSAFLFA